jgi:hypothetical protein
VVLARDLIATASEPLDKQYLLTRLAGNPIAGYSQ